MKTTKRMPETPDIDLKELEEWKERNLRERLQFIEDYAAWIKRTPNKRWSSEQKKIVDGK